MRFATYAIMGIACFGVSACVKADIQEGPAAAYLPQGVGFYGMNGDLTNGQAAGKPYIIKSSRPRVVSVEQPIELVPVEPIEDLGLTQ